MKQVFCPLVFAAVIGLAATEVEGQTQTATIQASATVMQPINVVGAVNLIFGSVFPGIASTVGVNAAGAGRFDVTGQPSAPVFVSFVLPASLTAGANSLPIGTWTGHQNTVNNPTSGTNFTPSAALTTATFSGTGQLFVFVGATVTPAVNQAPGVYNGTIQITVTY
jgi:spore coat protein U-like protein